jgi:PAS domain S-box-containing protein
MDDNIDDFSSLRDKLLGLGDRSFRKSYYPELQKRIEELEKTQTELKQYKEHLEELVHNRTDELKIANLNLQQEISERRRAEEALTKNRDRLERINNGLLQRGPDHDSNLNRLTALCGELLGADCALYNRMQGGLLCSIGQWQTPSGFKAKDSPAGHICWDVIRNNRDDAVLITELSGTSYGESDPNVRAYGLETYFGQVVKCEGQPVGALCVVYKSDYRPTDEDRRILGIIACAIGNEDKRKQAEEELKESQQRFISIIDFLPDATFVIDREGKVMAWNRAMEEMTGISAAAMLGKGGYEYALPFHGERRPILIDMVLDPSVEPETKYLTLESKGGVLAGQVFIPSLKGRATYLFGTAGALYDPRGNIVGAIESIRDITLQKQAEEALKESQQQLADIIDFLPDATFVIDREGKVIAWNRAMEEMTGISAAAMLGKGDYEYALPFYGERRPLLINHVLDPNETVEKKYLALERKGGVLAARACLPALRGCEAHLSGAASALYDPRGNVVGAIESIRNITDQKLMEEAVGRAEEKYRDIFENSVTGIYQSALDGRFLSLNMSIAEILGYDSPEELLNMVSDARQLYVHPERRTEMLRLIEEQGSAREFEAEYFRKDKSVVWVSLNVRTVHGRDGEIAYMEGTASDITDRKLLRAQLDQAQKMEAIGTLAGGIAHDFNNILTPIIGYTELSLNTVPEDSRLSHNMRQVILSANRAKDLVRQILTFSRKTEQERKPVQISLMIKETLKLLRSSLPSTIDIHQAIHADAIESTTMADPTQIHQVLMNLCTNAAHAMHTKGGTLAITLKNVEIGPRRLRGTPDMEPGPYLWLSVADTGYGMDEAVKLRIFDPYFTTKGPNEGTGLGLAVVYGIVKTLSGSIAVTSKPDEGTTFDVYLPRTRTIPAPPAEHSASMPTGKGLVLVVDDEKFIVDMVKEMLETLGYKTVSRYSSSDALEAFRARAESFDLVITDMTMPHMTGIDLAREIFMIRPNTPLILCTGFSETVDENKVISLGIKKLLMKPVSMRDLATTVSKVMARDVHAAG